MRQELLFLLLPALLCATSFQDKQPNPQGGDKPVETDIYGRPLKRGGKIEDLRSSLLGCWKLVDIDSADFPAAGRTQAGYLLIAEDFLAVETHIAWTEVDLELVDDDFQSGIHEYRLEGTGVLVTTSLIGSYLEEDDDGNLDLEWEDPGSERSFRVHLNGNFLTLRRDDGSSLAYSRVLSRRKSQTDIFGRQRPSADTKADPLGRAKKDK